MMLSLQAQGCHNINLVSPSHVVPQILAGLLIAAEAGLRLPLVYNTGGYDSLKTLALLDGVIDIYMPDMKYADAERRPAPIQGRQLSGGQPGRRQGDAPPGGRPGGGRTGRGPARPAGPPPGPARAAWPEQLRSSAFCATKSRPIRIST